MKKIYLFLVLFFAFIHTVGAFEASQLVGMKTSVYDETHTLSDTDTQDIEAKIQEIRQKYTVEILTVLISTTDGQDISQLATEIGQKVGVGKKDVDNGIVILIALQDHSWFIATGYGVEGALPDITCKKIGELNFPSAFKKNDYHGGIVAALGDMKGYLEKDPGVLSKLSNSAPLNEETLPRLFRYGIFCVIFSGLIFRKDLLKKEFKRFFIKFGIVYLITLPILYFLIGAISLVMNLIVWGIASILASGRPTGKGGFGGGRGGFGGGNSGSSGGGFGGGSFGGGGAGGKW